MRAKSLLKIIIIIGLVVLAVVWFFLRSATIIRVDGAAVYVQYLPLTIDGKIKWWNENKKTILSRYAFSEKPSSITIMIMNFDGYVQLPTGSNDGSADDYHCFRDIPHHNKCIYNDIAMVITGDVNNRMFIHLNDKTFIQAPDGKLTALYNASMQ